MSQRMTLEEVLKEYGVPQIKLDIHAKGSECRALREKLMDIVNLSGGREQGCHGECRKTAGVGALGAGQRRRRGAWGAGTSQWGYLMTGC